MTRKEYFYAERCWCFHFPVWLLWSLAIYSLLKHLLLVRHFCCLFADSAGVVQLYIYLSRNFDMKPVHQRILEEHPVTNFNGAVPSVDIFLSCWNESLQILENTYTYVQKMEYPEGRLKVHMLDDGTMPEVRRSPFVMALTTFTGMIALVSRRLETFDGTAEIGASEEYLHGRL